MNVAGPSLTKPTCMSAPKRPEATRADRSRIRLLKRTTSVNGTYSETWDDLEATGTPTEMRDSMVTVAYFFDRVPESKAGGSAI